MEIRRAVRKKAKLRLGVSAPSGAGKTYSSLLMASGIGNKIGMIDTENGSGDLYSDLLSGGYDIIQLTAPYDPKKYVEAIRAFESAGHDVIIIDSLTHAWAGVGGLLDKQGKIADKSGNTWTAWRTVTPEHNALVDTILQSSCHIIATMRAKQEYVQEKTEQGKTVVRKVGMSPVMRDGIEYEFTIFMELDHQHNASASKDRTGLFDGQYFTPSKETGLTLLSWLDKGIEDNAPRQPILTPDEQVDATRHERDGVQEAEFAKAREADIKLRDELIEHLYSVKNIVHLKNCWAKITAKPDGDYNKLCAESQSAVTAAKDDVKEKLEAK